LGCDLWRRRAHKSDGGRLTRLLRARRERPRDRRASEERDEFSPFQWISLVKSSPMLRSFCDNVSDRRRGPAHFQDAGNRQANDDESADEHKDCGQSTFAGETGFVHSGIEPSRRGSRSLLHTASRRPLRTPGLLRPAQLSNSYHAANAARTETIACSRGGVGRAPRSEVSKA